MTFSEFFIPVFLFAFGVAGHFILRATKPKVKSKTFGTKSESVAKNHLRKQILTGIQSRPMPSYGAGRGSQGAARH